MKQLLRLCMIIICFALPALAQNECPAGSFVWQNSTAANGTRHDIECIDNVSGRLSLPYLGALNTIGITDSGSSVFNQARFSAIGVGGVPGPSEAQEKIYHSGTGVYGLLIQTSAAASNYNALYLNYAGTDHAIGVDAQAGSLGGLLIDNHAGSGTFAEQIGIVGDAGGGGLQLNGMTGQTGSLLQWTLNGNQTFAGAIGASGNITQNITNPNALLIADATPINVLNVDTSGKNVQLANGTNLTVYSDNFSTVKAYILGSTGGAFFAGGASIGGGTALTTSNQTGTGSIVLATSPTLTTPNIGAATATSLALSHLALSSTAPTISSGFGTTPSIVANNGTVAFTVNVGTGGTASSGVIGLPTATTGWACTCNDLTTKSASVASCQQSASSTTSATLTNYNTSMAATAWVASDVLQVKCMAY